MAKRGRGSRLDSATTAIGDALGRIAAKVQKLERQRAALAAELRQVIDMAEDMLARSLAPMAEDGRPGSRQAG